MQYQGDLEDDMEDLVSAEDFLEFFDVAYERSVVQVNRLHILQRFHDYIGESDALSDDEAARKEVYKALLTRAYGDFVNSSAIQEKVFKVLKDAAKPQGFVSLSAIVKS